MGLYTHDVLLGHVPNPGFCRAGPGNSLHTIDVDGLRFTGQLAEAADEPILAVGDSFTFGDEVRDEEAWPARLQQLTGRRVLNGGVSGYGFDQVVLRTERLVAQHRPSVIIVGFLQSVWRMEMRRMWWRDKPWFEIEGDQLLLRGVPVSKRKTLPQFLRRRIDHWAPDLSPALQHLLGYQSRVHRSGQGMAIAKALVRRLADLRAQNQVKIVVMAQYPPGAWASATSAKLQHQLTRIILAQAASCGLATLDTFQRLAAETKPLDLYARTHMNARGNLLIASQLAAALPALLQGSATPRQFANRPASMQTS